MGFRYDMQDKTPQQKAIVAKRDAEEKRRKQETKKEAYMKSIEKVHLDFLLLVIDKDTCPEQDNIIIKQQCGGCKYYRGFIVENGQPCIKCSFKLDL